MRRRHKADATKHPPLDPASHAARSISRYSAFNAFVERAQDTIEIIGGPDELYVFTGSPPDLFGFLWFDHEGMHDARSAVEHGELTYDAAAHLVTSLATIYRSCDSAERFNHAVAGRWVTVTDSEAMYSSIMKAVQRVRAVVPPRRPHGDYLQDRMYSPQS